MGKVVAAVGMSHAPGALAFPETCNAPQRTATEKASAALGKTLTDSKPDVIFAFLDDHFENFYRNLMPNISISVAETHEGPADQWMETLRIPRKYQFPGCPEVAEMVLESVVEQGFDCARTGPVEYGNNLLMPWLLMNPTLPQTTPIIPIFINVFTPPLIKYSRAYDFGLAIRHAIETALPPTLRCALLCTGGLSHWPPYWNEHQANPADTFLNRMKAYQTLGKPYLKTDPNLFVDFDNYEIEMAAKNEYPLNSKHPLVNEEWDRMFMEKLCGGDKAFLRGMTYQEVEEQAGHGGHEVLNWVALAGAMRGESAKLLCYEPVVEWICGMTYVDFEVPTVE
ncbi:MAG: hypothetical protein M1834_009326 [Cirrosporium novae-zelandiae]|nr:MAG: hypothetical protein M1834_009326 [Cirrosporium novae-zelandiae]